MACNEQDTNCQPCKDCPTPPDPVLPRCDVALIDGTYTNTTIVVEDGCIVSVASGRAPQYTPDVCCDPAPSNGGGGDDGPCDCPPGADGENATIEIGSVSTTAYGTPATVTNVGTPTNAVLDFTIPRGQPGNDSTPPGGVTDDRGGIEFTNGMVTLLPATWPPVLYINATSSTTGVSLTAGIPDPTSGVTSLNIDLTTYNLNLQNWVNTQITNATNPLNTRITALENALASLQSQVSGLASQVASCC